MGDPERFREGQRLPREVLDGRHFYGAYIFDQAQSRQQDIETTIAEARRLNYPVRYWWLSEAMLLDNGPDRLIVCVHHPALGENAGMDLYEVLTKQQVKWDDFEAATVEEYEYTGKPIVNHIGIRQPDGSGLFLTSPPIKSDIAE